MLKSVFTHKYFGKCAYLNLYLWVLFWRLRRGFENRKRKHNFRCIVIELFTMKISIYIYIYILLHSFLTISFYSLWSVFVSLYIGIYGLKLGISVELWTVFRLKYLSLQNKNVLYEEFSTSLGKCWPQINTLAPSATLLGATFS